MMAACKKLINSVERCVDENLEGLVAVNPGLRLLEGQRVVLRADIEDHISQGKVSVLCGGGSGHEPAHAGYVGQGMLSAAVAGAVFTSPPPHSILSAINAISTPKSVGCLVLVANYTGDRLNFGLAVERARQAGVNLEVVVIGEDCALATCDKTAGRRGLCGTILIFKMDISLLAHPVTVSVNTTWSNYFVNLGHNNLGQLVRHSNCHTYILTAGALIIVKNYTGDRLNFGKSAERAKSQGIKVDMVVVGEDCALTSSDKTAGRRGLCGVLLIHKICGALSEEGKSLEEIASVAKNATTRMGTIGLSLTPCSVPGSGATFELKADEMELGLGVHGEAGVRRTKLVSAKEAVQMMIDHMTSPNNSTHLAVNKGDRVACMINNLGGTSMLELNILAKETIELLESRGVVVERAYCGTFITSLEMAGLSITLLHLDDTLRRCLDAPTTAPAWPKPLLPQGTTTRVTPKPMARKDKDIQTAVTSSKNTTVSAAEAGHIYDCLKLVAEQLIAAESQLNDLDKQSGDGDCGSTMARGAQAILSQLGSKDKPGIPVSCPGDLALTLANIAEDLMGGSSGGLYSLFFTAAAQSLQQKSTADAWCQALNYGIQTMMRYGGAEPGDRTMLDALHAGCTTLTTELLSKTPVEAYTSAVQAAEKAAEATASMKAKAGRASYVNAERLTHPDPGAVAVSIWMKAILQVISS